MEGRRGRRADLFTKRILGEGVDDSGYYIVTVLPAGYGKCYHKVYESDGGRTVETGKETGNYRYRIKPRRGCCFIPQPTYLKFPSLWNHNEEKMPREDILIGVVGNQVKRYRCFERG